jgi:putative adhesin/cell wall-active antibiotic response 4TMS protein YvqF
MSTDARPRSSGIFSGLVFLALGILFLLHNYRGLEFHQTLLHWWPLVIILWGVIKLYERLTDHTPNASASRITAGEVFTVVALIALVGLIAGIDAVRGDRVFNTILGGNTYDYDLEVSPKTDIAPDSRVAIRISRGDINVRSSDSSEIRVSGKKTVHAWNQDDAEKLADKLNVEIARNGAGYDIRPSGSNSSDSNVDYDMDIVVPKRAPLLIHKGRGGDIQVANNGAPVNITSQSGDIDIHDTAGDVNVETQKGDVKVADTKGDVKLSGKGGEVGVSSATGSLTIDGEFYGPIRADKVARGVRFISRRTDLTLTQLSGHMELNSGNLEITDAPGNMQLRTNRYDLDLENVGGKIKIDNKDGGINLRFSTPPTDDIELSNSNAGISVSLPGTASFEINADCKSCDIDSDFSSDSLSHTTSNSGDQHLSGKYGNGHIIKISLKTSYGSIRLHRTSGDDMAPPRPPHSPAKPKVHSDSDDRDIPEPQEN